MTTIIICLLITVLLPMIAKIPVAKEMAKLGGYDNREPRLQQDKLKGFGARALAAHQNAFEALILFTPGALAVIATGNVTQGAEHLAIVFVVCRVLYTLFYWIDIDKLRSAAWTIGFGCSLAMLWLALP